MSAAEVLSAHRLVSSPERHPYVCECGHESAEHWAHQAVMLAAAGLLVTAGRAVIDAPSSLRNSVRNAVSAAHATTCGLTSVTASNWAVVDAALGTIERFGLPTSASGLAEHDREVAARALREAAQADEHRGNRMFGPAGRAALRARAARIARGEGS